jgi:hypothetical protein
MFSILGYSKQITYYFKGIIDSLRDEILMRHMVLAYVSYALNLKFHMIAKLNDVLLSKFAPRAAKLESNRRYHHHHAMTIIMVYMMMMIMTLSPHSVPLLPHL